jgi:hypothetical protein
MSEQWEVSAEVDSILGTGRSSLRVSNLAYISKFDFDLLGFLAYYLTLKRRQ